MDIDDPDYQALLQAIDESSSPLRLVAVKCLSISPLVVSISGVGSVPAEQIVGQTWAVNDTGRALWSPPSKPLCIKVT